MRRILYVGNKLSSLGFTPTSVEYLGNLLDKSGYGMLYAGEKKNKASRFASILAILLLKRSQYDLVLIDVYSTLAFYFAFTASCIARMLHKPYITLLHGGNLPSRFAKSPMLVRALLGKATAIVSPSPYLYQHFKDAGFCKIFCIPNPISISKYPFFQRDSIKPNLLWVRSFHSIYNPQMAIRVVSKLSIKYPGVKLTMIGPDKDSITLRECRKMIREYNLSDNITIHGRLSKVEWISLARQCDIFINTTNFDNAPVSVIEAMALGLPVVSTNVGGIPFIVKDGVDSMLVDKNDVDGMVKKIGHLVSNVEFTTVMINKARQKVLDYDEGRVINKWNQLLSTI